MENKTLTIYSFSIPEVETRVSKLAKEYEEFIKIEAKLFAEKPGIRTETDFKISMDDPIKLKAQHELDHLAKWAQVRAQIFNARDSEQQSADEHLKLGVLKQEKQRQTPVLQQQKERLACNNDKLKYWKWVCVGALIAGCADAATAYSPIRNVYEVLPALIICTVIGAAVGTAHFGFVPWIIKAKTRLQKVTRISIILIIAAAFFYYVGSLRSAAAVAVVNIDPTNYTQTGPTVSPLAIAILSFVLFLSTFAVTMHFFVPDEERENIAKAQKAEEELRTNEAEIKRIEQRQEKIKTDALARRAEIRQLNDYYRYIVATIKTMAEGARKEFKRVFASYKSELPDFLATEIPYVFNEHANLFSDEKTK